MMLKYKAVSVSDQVQYREKKRYNLLSCPHSFLAFYKLCPFPSCFLRRAKKLKEPDLWPHSQLNQPHCLGLHCKSERGESTNTPFVHKFHDKPSIRGLRRSFLLSTNRTGLVKQSWCAQDWVRNRATLNCRWSVGPSICFLQLEQREDAAVACSFALILSIVLPPFSRKKKQRSCDNRTVATSSCSIW